MLRESLRLCHRLLRLAAGIEARRTPRAKGTGEAFPVLSVLSRPQRGVGFVRGRLGRRARGKRGLAPVC